MENNSNSYGQQRHDKATFGAPWGLTLKLMTTALTMLLFGASIFAFRAPRGDVLGLKAIIPVAIWASGSLFMIRGYVLTKDTLFIRRLFWDTRVPLTGLQSACVDPRAVRFSIRTFGNGGLFCFAGRFWNWKLGHYRVFVTNFKNIVVLRFADRTIVVTPSQPEEFVSLIKKRSDSIIT